jgi:hypothetical protein
LGLLRVLSWRRKKRKEKEEMKKRKEGTGFYTF